MILLELELIYISISLAIIAYFKISKKTAKLMLNSLPDADRRSR